MFYSWTLLLSVPLFLIMLLQAPYTLLFDKVRCAYIGLGFGVLEKKLEFDTHPTCRLRLQVAESSQR